MLLSVHLGSFSLLRTTTTGALWHQRALRFPLAAGVPRPRGAALLAAWPDADTLERASVPGWSMRLEPLRAVGAWPDLPELTFGAPAGDDERVAVLTLGRPRIGRMPVFLRTSARAEREAVEHPGMLYGTAMALPPRFVATFSVWSSVAPMREYVRAEHSSAMRVNAAKPFHHDQLFARFRPSGYVSLP